MADHPDACVTAAVVVTIVDVARQLGRSVPAPRGAPYYGLDVGVGYDLRVFDSLSARGIFRKYEFALEIGCGLGGRARWLAARTGCRVLGIDPCESTVAAGRLLNRRAGMDEQVGLQVGRPTALPLRERIFTHVWILDMRLDSALGGILREAHRVLRCGGHFAMQVPVPAPGESRLLTELLDAAGFVELEFCEVTLSGPPDTWRLAAVRLQGALQLSSTVQPVLPFAEVIPPRTCLQIFARRRA